MTEAPLADEGPAAPPRRNGELVFAEPWESRAFAMVVSLHDSGAFTWPAFRSALVARISGWEAAHRDGTDYRYYQHWLAALEDILDADGTLPHSDVDARADELTGRLPDHGHPATDR